MSVQQRNVRNTHWMQLALLLCLVLPTVAFAGGTGMPWEGWLDKILGSITGPVAKAIGVIAIVGCGLGIAFSEGGSGMRKLMMVCLGLSIAFTAASFFLNFLGYGGGAVF
jgi:type IV secretory pathway VirB2 component (pilin)